MPPYCPQPQKASLSAIASKVPEVTIYFWLIKVLCTTVGGTAADFLNTNLGLGLTGTTLVMGASLIGILVLQFRATAYVPWIYWLAVVLLSIVGTLIADNLVDNLNVSLSACTAIFGLALIATFLSWYSSEGTLSIHSINTTKREGFYWFAILFTFALGTAAGYLIVEKLDVGYWRSALIFAGLIAVVATLHFFRGLGAIVAFWIAYVLTRPLGASIGDYLSQDRDVGGLGLGTVATSAVFLSAIVLVVLLLSNRPDAAEFTIAAPSPPAAGRRNGER
jgi:uncharacterized membrane-anchored protein